MYFSSGYDFLEIDLFLFSEHCKKKMGRAQSRSAGMYINQHGLVLALYLTDIQSNSSDPRFLTFGSNHTNQDTAPQLLTRSTQCSLCLVNI